jgi:hypothetical protein
MDKETLNRLQNWLKLKLRQNNMSVDEVIEAIEKDDTKDHDILKCYDLIKRIKILEKIVK